ncbi:unnamed protein product [Danaus chrysippus]|uniref:(African queen) hypothetical protein n=1 Tax=Danaus chrysippus TaxID=151541 RepID=A0A8J2W8C0_9NEOP|nr:unnamed protein product [Danaus chrysippus]
MRAHRTPARPHRPPPTPADPSRTPAPGLIRATRPVMVYHNRVILIVGLYVNRRQGAEAANFPLHCHVRSGRPSLSCLFSAAGAGRRSPWQRSPTSPDDARSLKNLADLGRSLDGLPEPVMLCKP